MLRYVANALLKLGIIGAMILLLDVGCVFKRGIGIPCLGCGSTRATISFLQGDLRQALFYHPLFLLSILLIVIAVCKNEILERQDRKYTLTWISIAILYVVVYVWRMIMMFPHVAPMDYNTNSILWKLIIDISNFLG